MTYSNRLTDLVARLKADKSNFGDAASIRRNKLHDDATYTIQELMMALEPFADIAKEVDADSLLYCDIDITVSVRYLRAARAALEK